MRTPGDEDAALKTLEQALAAIRRDPDRDEHVERVIQAMEDERARLLAAKLSRRLDEDAG
jgi:N-formylglutamate amidohydrolase